MSFNSAVTIACGALLVMSLHANAYADKRLACPALVNGRPLDGFGLFKGDPSDHRELMPRNGAYDVPQAPFGIPPAIWREGVVYTLQCRYKHPEMNLDIVLPDETKICVFDVGLMVECQ